MITHPTVLAYEIAARRLDAAPQRAADRDTTLPARPSRLPLRGFAAKRPASPRLPA